MRYLITISLIILFQNAIFAQSKCPDNNFLGKWTDEKFGIEIKCDRIVILDKLNGWVLSERRSDTYYFLEPVMSKTEIFVTWVQNYAMYDFFTKGKWQKTSSKQKRIFKIEKINDGQINFSISEKIIKASGLREISIIKEDSIFEKVFTLNKLN